MTNSHRLLISALILLLASVPGRSQIISDLMSSGGLPDYGSSGIVSSTDTMDVSQSEEILDWNYTLEAFSDVKTITSRQLQQKIDDQKRRREEALAAKEEKPVEKAVPEEKEPSIPSYVNEDGIDLYLLTEDGIKTYMTLMFPKTDIPVTADLVKWIRFYGFNHRKGTKLSFERFKEWEPYIHIAFGYNGVPKEIAPLCIIESACTSKALSKVGAYGMWQIMPATGRAWGMKITATVDEREDPMKSTQVASKILAKSHTLIDDWILCVAGYNCGMTRIQGLVEKYGTKDWLTIKPHLPKETQQYIPSLLAITYIWNYRDKFGFES